MLTILKKELSSFFNSLTAYIVIGVFLILMGLMFWVYPNTNILDYGYAEMDTFFQFTPYFMLFFVPAITMRMFSEEIKSGTIELLFTKPISVFKIILGKYFSCVCIIFLALLPTLVYYISLYKIGNPEGNIDSAAVVGSYFGLILIGAVYAAIGLFMSALTKNQVVAFLLSACVCYLLFVGLEQVSSLFSGSLEYLIGYLSLGFHYNSLGKGLIDSRNIIYLLSVCALFLLLTQFSLYKLRK